MEEIGLYNARYYDHYTRTMPATNLLLYSITSSVEKISIDFNISSVSFVGGSIDKPGCFQFAVSVSHDYCNYLLS